MRGGRQKNESREESSFTTKEDSLAPVYAFLRKEQPGYGRTNERRGRVIYEMGGWMDGVDRTEDSSIEIGR